MTIPNSVTSIGDNAFDGCSGLTSVAIPNSVTSIGGGAFWDCSGLMNVTISNSVTSIGVCAFNGCSGLTSVTIPNSVTSIGVDAFRDCFGLTSVIIGESVTSIGDGAFYDCSNLNTVYSYAVIPPILDLGNFTTEQCQSMVLYVPKGTLEAYRAATNWGNIVNIREMDGTGVPSIVGGDNEAERTYYDMQGRKLVTPQRGLNIIDGRKVLIRE